jgi:hypothetical protein
MACARGAALLAGLGGVMAGGQARADRNDLRLINLCDASATGVCPWVAQTAAGPTVMLDADAATRFRSLMSELGVVVAPRLQTPADTLGFSGFQLSAELGFTEISSAQSFWNGTEGVQPANPKLARPPAALATVGAFVRKGMFWPVPAIELGAGAVNVVQSGMWALQAYAKVAVHEGFHQSAVPSLAVRFAFSDLVGTNQVDLKVYGLDVLVSKAFSMAGTWRLEPFVGWNLLLIDAQSGIIDATPAVATDRGANFRFPQQDLILRSRWFAGAKMKLWKLFLAGEVALATAGGSDSSTATGRADDRSGAQKSVTISAGLDF